MPQVSICHSFETQSHQGGHPLDLNYELQLPQALRQRGAEKFIAAVTEQALQYGITPSGILEATVHGKILIIGSRSFPSPIAGVRQSLVARVRRDGYEKVIDEMAYT